jgi:hypothetical protein
MEFDIMITSLFIPIVIGVSLTLWIIKICHDIKEGKNYDDDNDGGNKHPVYPDDKGFSEEILVKYK